MGTTISSLRQLTSDLPAVLGRIAREPQVVRETTDYLSSIRDVKSLDEFMQNDRVYRYALKAFGLEDMAYGKAFIRRVLSDGIDRRDSLANRLADPRFREFAEAFNFARYGGTATTFDRTQKGTVERYHRQALETSAGRSNEGVRLALYFQRKAASVTTPFELMADRALLKVTQVALGLSENTSALDIDRQAALIRKRIDFSDLQNPAKLDRLLTRFAALWDMKQPSTARASVVDLVAGTTSTGIGLNIPDLIQKARSGGYNGV